MALSKLTAGNGKGLDTSIKFTTTPAALNISVNGLVTGSNSQVQFTVSLDPSAFTCSLNAKATQVIIQMTGANKNPKDVVYTVDTGINEKLASPGSTAVEFQVIPTGQSTGSTYTFTKSTGGGARLS